MRVLVFQHTAGEHPAAFTDHMAASNDVATVVRLYEGAQIPPLDDYDMLLVMGGPMDVWEEAANPWLVPEKTAILDWVSNDRGPYLGVCLGHQLLAEAMGGTCAKAQIPEIGVSQISAREDAKQDQVFANMAENLTCFQWHGVEVARTPSGATTLYSSPDCDCQIMRVGARAYGVQFHPELTTQTIPDWLGDAGNRQAIADWMGQDGPEQLIQEVAAKLPAFFALSREIYRGIRVL